MYKITCLSYADFHMICEYLIVLSIPFEVGYKTQEGIPITVSDVPMGFFTTLFQSPAAYIVYAVTAGCVLFTSSPAVPLEYVFNPKQ